MYASNFIYCTLFPQKFHNCFSEVFNKALNPYINDNLTSRLPLICPPLVSSITGCAIQFPWQALNTFSLSLSLTAAIDNPREIFNKHAFFAFVKGCSNCKAGKAYIDSL